MFQLPMLPVSVPVDTQGPTARTEVGTTNNMHACSNWSMECMYTVYFISAACSPTCQNGGTCRVSSSNASCICPSGYSGSYCQKKGIDATQNMHARVCACVCVFLCVGGGLGG